MLSNVQKLRVLGYKIRRIAVRRVGEQEGYDWVNESLGVEAASVLDTFEDAVAKALDYANNPEPESYDACPTGEVAVEVKILDPDVTQHWVDAK